MYPCASPSGCTCAAASRPVERLGTARTGIDIHDSAHTVLVTAQHVAQFEFLDAVHRTRVLFVELLLGHHALLDEFRHQPQVLDLLDHSIVLLDPRLDSRHAAQLFAGLVGIIPKARNLRLLLLVLEFYSSLVDVKDTSQRILTSYSLFNLFCKYHIFRLIITGRNRAGSSARITVPPVFSNKCK